MPPVDVTASPQQKTALRKASSATVETRFRKLNRYFRNARWLPNSNRYRDNCVDRLKADCRRSVVHPGQLIGYIAASALPHVLDGWGFVGRALNAQLRGDFVSCRHLAYYAELRASMALLASQGVGIFDKDHFVVKHDGSVQAIPGRDGTHVLAWKALDHWSGLKRSTALLAKIITPGGLPISDWQSGIFSDAGFRIVGRNWLKRWDLDIQQCANDQRLRNISSYRPSRLSRSTNLPLEQRVQFLKDFWRMCEPSGAEPFQRLDRHLLRMWLRDQYSLLRGRATNQSNPDFVREIESLIDHVNPQGLSKALWTEFLCDPTRHPDPVVMTSIDSDAVGDVAAGQLGMLARALMLLRIATGATRQLLVNSGVPKDQLEFWWHDLGTALALWDPGNEPDNLQSLWLDVEKSIDDIESWISSQNRSAIRTFRTSESAAIVVIDELERVGLWGVGL